jgi:DNA-binding GntR family transcriptional regulator
MPTQFTLDRSSPVPLYHQLAMQIERDIERGDLKPGDWVETEVDLAERLGLGRPTVRQAMQVLVNKGLVVRRRGVGTQVVQTQLRRSVELSSLYDDLARANRNPGTQLLARRLVKAPDGVSTALGLPAEQRVIYLHRLRTIDNKPLAIMQNWLPADLLGEELDLIAETGLYELLRRVGVQIHLARQRIGARSATRAEGRLLEIKGGSPLLTMERTTYDTSGRAVEFATHCYRADTYSFETTLLAH